MIRLGLTDFQLFNFQLESALKGLHAMHQLNLRHLNPTPSHLIVPTADPDGAVWIDFNPTPRSVNDMFDDGTERPWGTVASSDPSTLWIFVGEYFNFQEVRMYEYGEAFACGLSSPCPGG